MKAIYYLLGFFSICGAGLSAQLPEIPVFKVEKESKGVLLQVAVQPGVSTDFSDYQITCTIVNKTGSDTEVGDEEGGPLNESLGFKFTAFDVLNNEIHSANFGGPYHSSRLPFSMKPGDKLVHNFTIGGIYHLANIKLGKLKVEWPRGRDHYGNAFPMDPDLNVTIDFPLTGIPPLTDAMRQAIIAANAPPAKVPPMPAPVPPPSSIEPTKFEWSEPVMGVQILVKVVDMTRPGFLKPVTRISDLPISVEVRNRGSDGSPLAIWQKHDQTGGVEFFTKDDQGQRIPVTGTSALYATRATSVARGDGEDDIIRMPFRTFAQLKGDLYASITFVDAATGQPFEVVSPPIKGAAIASFLNSLNPEVFSSIKSITTSSAPAPTAPSP